MSKARVVGTSNDSGETVVLVGVCDNREKSHELYRVLDTGTDPSAVPADADGVLYRVLDTGGGVLFVDAPRFAAGRPRHTWTPRRERLRPGHGLRYGCGCGQTALVEDREILKSIRRGETIRIERCYRV